MKEKKKYRNIIIIIAVALEQTGVLNVKSSVLVSGEIIGYLI